MRGLTPARIWRAVRWRVRNAWILWRLKRRSRGLMVGEGVRVSGRLYVRGPGTVTIGDHCEFAGEAGSPNVIITGSSDSRIEIGAGCRLNGAHIQAASSIILGADCLVADCHIVDTDFHAVDPEARKRGDVPAPRPVIIGNEVWICSRAAILKGVTIGDRAVVGYRAVVRRNVPANAVVIGNPATVVKILDGSRQEPRTGSCNPNVEEGDECIAAP